MCAGSGEDGHGDKAGQAGEWGEGRRTGRGVAGEEMRTGQGQMSGRTPPEAR